MTTKRYRRYGFDASAPTSSEATKRFTCTGFKSCDVETAKTSTEKSKDYTKDQGVDILTQIGVSKEDIEVV